MPLRAKVSQKEMKLVHQSMKMTHSLLDEEDFILEEGGSL